MGDLYPFTSTSATRSCSPVTLAAVSSSTWHNRLGHPGVPIFNFLRGNNFIACNGKLAQNCVSCSLGKHIRLPFKSSTSVTFAPFDIIHADLWTSPIPSSLGHKYYLVLLDDFSHYVWLYPLKFKSEVFVKFLEFRNFIQTQFGKGIKSCQCDNGREFNNSMFHRFCTNNGMIFRFSCPHTSPQNGKAERIIRTINNMIRTLLIHASLPPPFWVYAAKMSEYTLNILHTSTLHNMTPTEILYHRIPSYDHLRIFGCLCYLNLSSTAPHKLAPRSTPCVFLGFPPNHRGYLCYDLSTSQIHISRHVTFDETTFLFSNFPKFQKQDYSFLDESAISPLIIEQLTSSVPSSEPRHPNFREACQPSSTATLDPGAAAPPTASPPPSPYPTLPPISDTTLPPTVPTHPMETRSKHGIFKPKVHFNLSAQTISPLPKNPKLAKQDPNWNAAIYEEFNALTKQHTWDLVPRPEGVNVIRCMWLFSHKFRDNGDLERYKARLVANGTNQ
ncbi:hypothetical protein RND71_028329 [Anisodus tanguticus]|uniref:Integrase catalytic domain-containing protein n=1 Tax=Anisodus tanguticus TaxID=243964 RepID=A0AAE1V708_9SOLA|nr:hypothetical protein RND71_028329 [Anisodus tanguticus]